MKRSKVVFATLNSKYIHSSLAPWCLFTSSREKCREAIDFSVFEGTVNEREEDIFQRLMKESPDVLSFSCYIWNITKTLSLCKRIKEAKAGTVIILGGPEVAYNQREVLTNNSFIDYVVSGEGENVVPILIDCIIKGEECKTEGVSFIRDNQIHISDGADSYNENYPSPYCEEYFASLGGRIAYIESSRGCPFNCAFCLSGRCGKVRFFPLDRIKNEMLDLCRRGAKTVKFVDRTFNCNKERAEEILLFIKENYGKAIPDDVCFHFEIAADILNESLLSVISEMPKGSVQFEAGIQSFNGETLKAINRKTDIDKLTKNLKILLSFGNCHVHIDLIAGLPLEGYDSFAEGFNKAYELGANMLQLGFLKILHGSPMDENREKYPCVYSKEPPYEVASTPYITEEELERLHKTENELERLYNSSRFRRTLEYVLSVSKLTPFELFYSFGLHLEKIGEKGSIPLDKYICLAFDFFSSLGGVEKKRLRDVMICDRLATNNSGVIPERLKVKDPALKKVRNYLSQISPMKKGVLRSVAILYGENAVIWCDYDEKDRVTGEYKVRKLSL